jgi:hypothetical protein
MKYMLLIYNDPAVYDSWSEEERTALFGTVDDLMAELTASGEWLGGEALVPAAQGRIVRVRDGAPVVTDGPYAEGKEHFAGYLMVDVASEERAVEIAARWPDAQHFTMEVRALHGA